MSRYFPSFSKLAFNVGVDGPSNLIEKNNSNVNKINVKNHRKVVFYSPPVDIDMGDSLVGKPADKVVRNLVEDVDIDQAKPSNEGIKSSSFFFERRLALKLAKARRRAT